MQTDPNSIQALWSSVKNYFDGLVNIIRDFFNNISYRIWDRNMRKYPPQWKYNDRYVSLDKESRKMKSYYSHNKRVRDSRIVPNHQKVIRGRL